MSALLTWGLTAIVAGVGPLVAFLHRRRGSEPGLPILVVLFGLLLSLGGVFLDLNGYPGALLLVPVGGGLAFVGASFLLAHRNYASSRTAASVAGPARPRGFSPYILPLVLLGLVASDLLLGGISTLASGATSHPTLWNAIATAVLSPAFLLAAAAQMIAAVLFLPRTVDLRIRGLLAGQAGLLLFGPTTMPLAGWSAISTYLGSALMVAMFVTTLQFIYRQKQLAPSTSRLLVRWSAVAMLTAAGWFLWHLDATDLLLVPAAVAQLVSVLYVGLTPEPATEEARLPWLLHPFWVFQILLFTFLTEFFLGALVDLSVAGPGFLQYIPFLPLSGAGSALAGAAVYDGLWFAAAILASAWFLVLLGFTMGSLVVFKMRETHEKPQRYRLALMIAVYALAAIYIPSFASSTPLASVPALANLPVIGWGFGLRAGGPFESGIFLAILIMYASVGVLTLLFGRKALCSVMCGAALMYQGTAINEMRAFNQSSRVGRYFLGSQLSTAYTVASSLALVSLFGTSLLGVLRLLPTVQVANGQFDTSALPLPIELYFGALWFVMFVSTPYIGTYSCATTGFCHWGALSLPFAKVGMFRLKVKDRKVCQACTTFDCAKACPVGLVDMPQYFRTTGEYRSTKCCGVGDCVGACPYGNMYHQDVRLWLRRRLGRATPSTGDQPLPMVRARRPERTTPEPRPSASGPT
ncbi:MAG: hypothetical protein L3K07_06125 [Thermoplasmata archaeon]|nr:hypothetical protein [Thermoplasmata archaeon]